MAAISSRTPCVDALYFVDLYQSQQITTKHTRCLWDALYVMVARQRTVITSIIQAMRPRKSSCHFADDNFKCIFLIMLKSGFEFYWNLLRKVQSITCQHWFRKWFGAKPLSEPMVASLLTPPRCVKSTRTFCTTLHLHSKRVDCW